MDLYRERDYRRMEKKLEHKASTIFLGHPVDEQNVSVHADTLIALIH